MCWGEYKTLKLAAVVAVPAFIAVTVSDVSIFEGLLFGASAAVVAQIAVA